MALLSPVKGAAMRKATDPVIDNDDSVRPGQPEDWVLKDD